METTTQIVNNLLENKCEICRDTRYYEKCHIIPTRIGGGRKPENTLTLCPNHHKLLDYGLLTNEELLPIEKKIIALTNDPIIRDNFNQLSYLYFLLGLRERPDWLPKIKRNVNQPRRFL